MKKFKFVVGEPVVVAQGPTYEEASWGPWQFPTIGRADDGRVMVSVNISPDNEMYYGDDPAWFASDDEGRTWYPVSVENAAVSYTKLSNGDRIGSKGTAPYEPDPEMLDGVQPVFNACGYADVYLVDDVDPKYMDRVWKFHRVFAGETERKETVSRINYWPNMAFVKSENGIIPPFQFGRIRVAPDGSVWATDYGHMPSPYTGEYPGGLSQFYFRSVDNGWTWDMMSWLDPRQTEGAYVFCESDIAWTSNGTAVTLIRGAKSYIAQSKDGGRTWNTPVEFDEIGVMPAIASLKCGALIASYGRPGFFVRASFDPDGEVWEEPVEIIGNYDHTSEMNEPCESAPGHSWGTCSYSDILPISDNEALVVYTDFFVPDAEGIKRKSLMVVKVSVVEE